MANTGNPQQLNLIDRKRRRLREVRKLANAAESFRATLLLNPGVPVFEQAAHDCSQKAFAIARQWHGK